MSQGKLVRDRTYGDGDRGSSQSGAELIIEKLAEAGATTIFGYPGESTLALYAATQSAPGLSHVMARCERCAGYMADGYARFAGRSGLCDAPGGVGTPWLVPALHEAWASAIPMIAITTSSPAAGQGRWPTTHCENDRLFGSVAKAVLRLTVAERTAELTDRAVALAAAGRPGPVVLDVEPGLLEAPAPRIDGRTAPGRIGCPPSRPRPDRDQLCQVAQLLISGERPLLIVGGGIHLSGGYQQLRRLVDRHGILVATTFNGKGAVPEQSASWLGVVGAKGHPTANEEAARADVVLWIGSKGGDKSTQYGAIPSPAATVAHVDIDPEAPGRTFPADAAICADAGAFLADLEAAIEEIKPGWRCPSWHHVPDEPTKSPPAGELSSARLIEALRPVVGEPFHVVADASKASSWTGVYFRPGRTGRSIIAPRGSGSIGYAVPAAIGAGFARPGEPGIVVTGDGGFAMSCHELEIAVQGGLELAVIVLNNRSLGLLEQVGRHKLRPDFRLPGELSADWCAVARGYGCSAVQVGSMAAFAHAMAGWRAQGGVLVIDAAVPAAETSLDFEMFRSRQGAAAW